MRDAVPHRAQPSSDDRPRTETVAQASQAELDALFTLVGTPVSTQLSQADPQVTGTDETVGRCVTGEFGGAPFALVGTTVRVGGHLLALVGWDPATNEANVGPNMDLMVQIWTVRV